MTGPIASTLRCDVLVVGGGGAALRAAHDAAVSGASVVVVTRARRLGLGGATSFGVAETAGYSLPDGLVDPEDDAAAFEGDILRIAQGCAYPELAAVLAGDALGASELLRDNGLEFMRNADGSELVARGDFASRSRNRKILGHGKPIADLLARLLARLDTVQVLASSAVVDLLLVDGRVHGALAVDRDGALVAIAAGATVMATGGAGQLFEHSLMPPDICGAGYALAARAGAELVNMEFVQAGFGTLRPAVNIVMPWYWGAGAELLDGEEQSLLPLMAELAGASPTWHDLDVESVLALKRHHYPFSTSDASGLLELTAREAGRSRPLTSRGGLLMRLPATDDDPHGFWTLSRSWLADRGFDIERGVIDVALFGHSVNGGIAIDVDARSTVPGLLAAGEATGGAYGADRLGGSMLLSCQVFGRRAAASAVADAAGNVVDRAVLARAVDASLARLPEGRADGTAPRELMTSLQRAMTEHVLIDRDATSLQSALTALGEIATAIDDAEVRVTTTADRLLLEDVRNLALVGTVMVHAALARDETRGAHYRRDFPLPDEAQARPRRWTWLDGIPARIDHPADLSKEVQRA